MKRLQFIRHEQKQTILKADFPKPTIRNAGFNVFCGFPDCAIDGLQPAPNLYGDFDFYGLDGFHGWVHIQHPDGTLSYLWARHIEGKGMFQFS